MVTDSPIALSHCPLCDRSRAVTFAGARLEARHSMKKARRGSGRMKLNVEIDCTPAEARAFLGLPDVTALNDHLVEEMKKRMDANIAMAAPEELMKNWMAFGGQASEQFMKLMSAASGGLGGAKGGR
jgi:hypothetical protein